MTVLKLFLSVLITAVCIVAVPFISFGKPIAEVCKDAAVLYGIKADEYQIEFTKKVVNANGEEVSGTFTVASGEKQIYTIRIQKSVSRAVTVATIFHEFAHAAQHKYGLWNEKNDYTHEQHAELLAFNTMWHSGYWWNAVHMLYMHTAHAKPADYLAPEQIWKLAVTGQSFK
jgi:hypothetical protein